MDEQDQMRAVRLDQLRTEIRKGLESGAREHWDADAIKRQARTRRSPAKIAEKA